jgi:branched-subunit amino acid ABC-type transport system permease component
MRLLLAVPIVYIVLLLGQPAGLDLVKIFDIIRNDPTIVLQQLITGIANGAIIVIIALGYTLVYGIIELVNFAHGDLFMLGTFTALFALSPFIIFNEATGGQSAPWWAALLGFIPCMIVCAAINVFVERVAYRRLRKAPKIVALISAIGMSFILQNVGLQIASVGKLALVDPSLTFFGVMGRNNAAPKSFPVILSNDNLLDLIFPPVPATVAPDAAPADGATSEEGSPVGELSPDDVQATVEASINATLEAEMAAAAEAPLEEAPAEEATPDPAVVVVEGEATPEEFPTEKPTVDLAATIAAEDAAAAEADGTTTASADGQQMELVSQNKIRITIKDVIVIVVALVLMLALRWFVQNTRLGKAMRATASNRDAAQIMGINIDQIIALTFAIGGALAGAAGMMTGLYNGTAVFTMGFTAGLRSFTAAVLGGIGNITGAALGGILIGILAAFSDQFLSVRWTNAWVFLILVLVLLFRPTGLLGQEGGEKA